MINTFTEAVQTVDPKQAVGKLHHLWANFGKFYEENDQLDDARVIFEKATHVPFLKVDDLASAVDFCLKKKINNSYINVGSNDYLKIYQE